MIIGLQTTFSSLVQGSFLAVLTLGFSLIYFSTRILHFAHVPVALLAGYMMYSLRDTAGLWWPIAMGLGVLLGATAGVLFEIIVYSPIRNAGGNGVQPKSHILFIASLGGGLLLTSLLGLVYGTTPLYFGAGPYVKSLLIMQNRLALSYIGLIAIAGALVSVTSVLLWLAGTESGRSVRAVIEDENSATVVGINVHRIYICTAAVGSALAGLAACFIITTEGVDSQGEVNLIVLVIAASLLGGVGSVPGSVVGAYIISIVTTVPLLWLPASYAQALGFVVLLLVVAVRPHGLLGVAHLRKAG